MSAKPTLARSDRGITLVTRYITISCNMQVLVANETLRNGCFLFTKTLSFVNRLCYTVSTLINERISMTVSVEYKPSLDYLSKVGGSFGVHSRLNKDHYTSCQACLEDHLDLLQDIAQDED